MSTQTASLQVSRAKVLTAYQSADNNVRSMLTSIFGQDIFNMKITDLVKTFEDALEVTGEDWNPPAGLTTDELNYRKLKIIIRALNEGWVPDWSNNNQPKYFLWMEKYTAGVGFSDSVFGRSNSFAGVGSRLCLRSSELALHLGKHFMNELNGYFL